MSITRHTLWTYGWIGTVPSGSWATTCSLDCKDNILQIPPKFVTNMVLTNPCWDTWTTASVFKHTPGKPLWLESSNNVHTSWRNISWSIQYAVCDFLTVAQCWFRIVSGMHHEYSLWLLYNFEWFVSHMSQPICTNTGNNFILILTVFGDLLEKSKKSHGDELYSIIIVLGWQYLELLLIICVTAELITDTSSTDTIVWRVRPSEVVLLLVAQVVVRLVHQENPKKTYLPLLTYWLNSLDQVH
jgi:hypothetical protein